VCSDDPPGRSRIEPFRLRVPPHVAWAALREALSALPRTRVTVDNGGRLRVEARTAVLRFVDDLEFRLRPAQALIAVRSESRIGRGDLGVNRRRLERLRRRLQSLGIVV